MSQIQQFEILFTSASTPPIELTRTLSVEDTTVYFEDSRIHEGCSVAVYSDLFGLYPTSVEAVDGQITVVFPSESEPERERDVEVKVRFV